MKKLFTTLVMSVACAFAMAQAPDQINYQAVCGATNTEVTVEFAIVKGEETVYTETQTVKTNAAGVFTTKVGGAEGWADVNWAEGGLQLKTVVNGVQVSVCDFATVPYAKLAEKYVGQEYIENDVQDLVEGMRGKANVDDIYVDGVNVAVAGYEMALKLTDDLVKEGGVMEVVEANKEAIDIVSSDLQGVVENMRMKANAADVDQAIEEEHTYAKTAIDWITNFPEEYLTKIQDAITAVDVTGEVQGLQEVMRMKANASDVAELQDQMEIVSGDLQGVVEGMRGKANVEDIYVDGVNVAVAGYEMALKLTDDLVKEGGVMEVVEANKEAIDIVSSDLQGVVENMRMKANAADVDQAIEEEHTYAKTAIDWITNFPEEYLTKIQDAITAVDVTSEVQGLQEVMRMKANASDVAELQDQMEIVSGDLQGVVEGMRDMASAARLEALINFLIDKKIIKKNEWERYIKQ